MRILASIVLLATLLYLPSWAAILMMISFVLVFNFFYEGMMLGYVADLVYGPEAILENGFALQYFITFSIILLVLELLKTRLKFYSNNI